MKLSNYQSNLLSKVVNNSLYLTLHCPRTNNALNLNTLNDLNDRIIEFENNNNLQNLIIKGNQKYFSSGYDLKELIYNNNLIEDSNDSPIKKMLNISLKLKNSKKNTISYINGSCYGIGTFIPLSCKYKIIDQNGILSLNNSLYGFPFVTYYLLGKSEKQINFLKFLHMISIEISPKLCYNNLLVDCYSDTNTVLKLLKKIETEELKPDDLINIHQGHNLKPDQLQTQLGLKINIDVNNNFVSEISDIFGEQDLSVILNMLNKSKIKNKIELFDIILLSSPLSLFTGNIQFELLKQQLKEKDIINYDYNLFLNIMKKEEYINIIKNKTWKYNFKDIEEIKDEIFDFKYNLFN